MNKNKIILSLGIGFLTMTIIAFTPKRPIIQQVDPIDILHDTSSMDFSNLELNKENFFYICTYYGIEHPEIVYSQAILESGHFTSKVYRSKNNFLGLYNSRKKDYYNFSHWSLCLLGYRDYVQSKWNGEDYYSFLKNLPYAEDPNYIKKIKILSNRL